MISLEDCFSFIDEKGPLLVAVSGGSDSMALLFLANSWARKTGREIHAVTVDHGLRPEAAAEAAFVAMVCDGLDIVHTTLAWDGIKPVAGISMAARNARYELMEEFGRDIGVRIILTGHTADDQAETVWMRMLRSAGPIRAGARGHSGMCARTILSGGSMLMRPLLNLSRQQLRQYLNDISQSWIEDPGNHDESFERVRVRQKLNADTRLKTKLYSYLLLMGRMREVVAKDAAILLASGCRLLPGRVFVLNVEKLRQCAKPVATMALKTVIATAGGGSYLIGDQQVEHIWNMASGTGERRITLGNCIVEHDGNSLMIYREARNLNAALVEPGETLYWDGRLHITNDSEEQVRVEAMSNEYIHEQKDAGLFKSVRKAVLLSSPLIITSDPDTRIPVYFDKSELPTLIETRTGAKAIENFCPQWEFSLLEWLKMIDLETDQNSVCNQVDRNDLTD